jgi:hypothetical protein
MDFFKLFLHPCDGWKKLGDFFIPLIKKTDFISSLRFWMFLYTTYPFFQCFHLWEFQRFSLYEPHFQLMYFQCINWVSHNYQWIPQLLHSGRPGLCGIMPWTLGFVWPLHPGPQALPPHNTLELGLCLGVIMPLRPCTLPSVHMA